MVAADTWVSCRYRSKSPRVILPCKPEPGIRPSSMPYSRAHLRAKGEARTKPAKLLGSVACREAAVAPLRWAVSVEDWCVVRGANEGFSAAAAGLTGTSGGV